MREWKTFSAKELSDIQKNRYVKSATINMIRFTVEFKEEFWRRYVEEHQQPAKIMAELGFDADVLGETRIAGILMHIREQFNKGEGFRDIRKTPEPKTPIDEPEMPTDETPPSLKAIYKVQHRLAYLEQEMEFIKKNILADNEARRKK